MNWQSIDTAPSHGKQILVGFMGQYEWFSYVAPALGVETGRHMAFALPEKWTEITPPKEDK